MKKAWKIVLIIGIGLSLLLIGIYLGNWSEKLAERQLCSDAIYGLNKSWSDGMDNLSNWCVEKVINATKFCIPVNVTIPRIYP